MANRFPENWDVMLLDDCMDKIIDYRGKTPRKVTSGIPLNTAKIVKDGRIDTPNEFIDPDEYSDWMRRGMPKVGDVLLTTEAPLGEIAQIKNEKVALAQRLITLRGKRNLLDNNFLKYLMLSAYVQEQLEAHATGTTVIGIKQSELRKISLLVPPHPEQKAIAHVLGTLDDKIELNRLMNETLEAMARAIFKSWFVDFDPVRAKSERRDTGLPKEISDLFPSSFVDSELGEVPKGWKVGVLDELTEMMLGGDWGKDELNDNFTEPAYCIRGADIPSLQSGGVGKMPLRFLKDSSLEKRTLKPCDLVVEISGGSPTQSTGRPVLITNQLLRRLDSPLICSNFCRMVKLKDSKYSIFVYLWLRRLYANDEFLQYENGTTGIKNFAFSLFSSLNPLIIPPKIVIYAFEEMVNSYYSLHQENGVESESLCSIRDNLLPKLISGEIRVKNV